MRWSLPLLSAAIVVFFLSSVLVITALERNAPYIALSAVFGMLLSTVLFVLSIWLPRRRVDWERIEAEQRLWESGPLGRSWLQVRRRLFNLWKF